MFNARIIVLNYNGAELLHECLPSLVKAQRRARLSAPLTILDNLSTDESEALVRAQFPEVEWVRAPENLFLCSYNDHLRKITESVVILLNNDIRVDENFAAPLLQKFEEDPKAFLVAPRVMSFDGQKIEAAKTKGEMRWGIFWSSARYEGYQEEAMLSSETFSSGFGAFSREKFLSLGGYDTRYLPGIGEDIDLCYRAALAGHRLYYEPQSVVYHMGQASFKKAFGATRIQVIAHRNNFIFMWKNFRHAGFWMEHLVLLPFRLLFALLRGNWAFVRGFFEALSDRRGV